MTDINREFSQIPHPSPKLIVWLVMWMTVLGQAAMTLYLPAFPYIAADLHVEPLAVKHSLTTFLIGYGFSQLIYGPLSDRYGRKPMLLIGLLIFGLGCMINVFIDSQTEFLMSRLIQGLGCGAPITIGRSILRDCFSGPPLASAASYLSMGFAIGLGVSPIIGAHLTSYFNWRTDFMFLILLTCVLFVIFYRWLPETNTLKREKSGLNIQRIYQDYRFIFKNFHFLQCMFGGLFAYAVIVAYNVMTPFLMQNVMGYSANIYGWFTFLIALTYFSAASINRILALKFSKHHLYIAGIALILLSGVAMGFASFQAKASVIFIIIPMIGATFGQALIFPNTIAAAMNYFPQQLASRVSALMSSLQMLLVGVLSALMAIPTDNSAIPLALTLIVLSICLSIILWKTV